MVKFKNPPHPGEILQEDFLLPLGIAPAKLAAHIGVTPRRITDLIRGKHGVTPEMAQLLAMALGTTADYWLSFQNLYDINRHPVKVVIRSLRRRQELQTA